MTPAPFTWRAGFGYLPRPQSSSPDWSNSMNGYGWNSWSSPPPSPPSPYWSPPPFGAGPTTYYGQGPSAPPPWYAPPPPRRKRSLCPPIWGPFRIPEPTTTYYPYPSAPPPPYSEAKPPRMPPGAGSSKPPPHVRKGVNVLYAKEYTRIHLINLDPDKCDTRGFVARLTSQVGVRPNFSISDVPTSTTVRDLIARCGQRSNGWAVTEVHEMGSGRWAKGLTLKYDDFVEGAKPVEEFGWDGTRGGKNGRPVWLVLHQV